MNGGRPRTLIGSYGTISVTRRGASYVALARIRDADGRLRRVTGAARTESAARARLKERLLDRPGFGAGVNMPSAYRSIHWPTILLIVGMLPFALALQRTGGVDLVVDGLLGGLGDANPTILLGGVFVLTAVIGLFVSNTATAVLMGPIAIGIATQLGVSPYPFAMVVALAASAAFMTPVSSPVNTLVVEPGRYSFLDFFKVGAPFTIVVLLVSVLMVPLVLPF